MFAKSPKAKGEYCPHPTTWLNSGCWEDDPKEWQDGSGDQAYEPPAPPTDDQLREREAQAQLKVLMRKGEGRSPEAEKLRVFLDKLEQETS